MVKITGTVPASAPLAWGGATATARLVWAAGVRGKTTGRGPAAAPRGGGAATAAVGLASWLTIAPGRVPAAIVAPTGVFSTTVNVSLASTAVSPLMVMVK